ncbi:hypothetical protein LTR08_007717 [Meristemomyces frigidus]|nr:hypothetical protein LTR08_007717 [Meristemomyces frigidus]
MGKKRRERDRPKSTQDAAYNPNKRVLLSYASDDEQEDVEQPAGTGHNAAVDVASANYQIAPYPEDDGGAAITSDGEPTAGTIASEGVSEAADDGADGGKGKGSAKFSRGVTRNVTTGQMPAIGTLAYQWDEDDEDRQYESAEEEAMAYLRAVRSERQSLPTVFAASHMNEDEELYEGGAGDTRGYLSEGTYIARPTLGPALPESAKMTMEPQEAYTTALRRRFLDQREQMHAGSSEKMQLSLGRTHPTVCRTGNNKAYAEWTRLLRTTPPLSAQVRLMDHDTVYALLAMVQKMFLVRAKDIAMITSAWVWSLLTRLDDVGTMSNDQVAVIREFGKKAVLVQLSLHDPAAAQQLEAIGADSKAQMKDDSDINITNEDMTEPNNGGQGTDDTSKGTNEESPGRQNTLATLDMVITVVGDVFGQRDLLEFRQPWNVCEDEPGHLAT